MGNPVAYFEIVSPDADRARHFYGELFGWKAEADPDMGGYALVDTGAGPEAIGGGIGAADASNPPGVRLYMRVEDLPAALDAATALGAATLAEPMDLPGGWGRIAVVADPDGNPVGLWA
jgi:uncharacterized protein